MSRSAESERARTEILANLKAAEQMSASLDDVSTDVSAAITRQENQISGIGHMADYMQGTLQKSEKLLAGIKSWTTRVTQVVTDKIGLSSPIDAQPAKKADSTGSQGGAKKAESQSLSWLPNIPENAQGAPSKNNVKVNPPSWCDPEMDAALDSISQRVSAVKAKSIGVHDSVVRQNQVLDRVGDQSVTAEDRMRKLNTEIRNLKR